MGEVAERVPTDEGHVVVELNAYGLPIQQERQTSRTGREVVWMVDANNNPLYDERGQPIPALSFTRQRSMPRVGITRTGEQVEIVDTAPPQRPRITAERRNSMYPARVDPIYNYISPEAIRGLSDDILFKKYHKLQELIEQVKGTRRAAVYNLDPDYIMLSKQNDLVEEEIVRRTQ